MQWLRVSIFLISITASLAFVQERASAQSSAAPLGDPSGTQPSPTRIGEAGIEDVTPSVSTLNENDSTPERIASRDYVDLDAYAGTLPENYDIGYECCSTLDRWDWQVLPDGVIYQSYLAGEKESRFSSNIVYIDGDGWLWDAKLGTRVTILRFGPHDPVRPVGFGVEVEGAALMRLDVSRDVNVRSGDYRGGIQAVYGTRRHQTRFGYYHISSHLGDEFLLKNPGYPRLNFVRDVIILGHSIYFIDAMRLYGEVGYAFNVDISEQWEFQFGADIAPPHATGIYGAPFFAINVHLREEVDFGGGLTVQTGWAWRGDNSNKLLRFGLQYFTGKSTQYSFYNNYEEQFVFGLWYDF